MDSKYQFEVLFIPQLEGGFTVEVPDLPGCISEGETLEEAEENIKEAIGLYLDTLEDQGLPLPNRNEQKIFKTQVQILKKTQKKYAKT